MTAIHEIPSPTILPFPASNCGGGKISALSNRSTNILGSGIRRSVMSGQPIPLAWVTLQVYASSSGYSVGALRQKIRRGHFIEGKHFRKAPDGRVLMNVEACQNWGIEK